MKTTVVALLVAASSLLSNADELLDREDLPASVENSGPAPASTGVLLPHVVTRAELADVKKGTLAIATWTKTEYDGQLYWVAAAHVGDGVPHTFIGVYAPAKDGKYHRCLFAESWTAGLLKATVNRKTGMLELREHANSELKGQVILSCNLKSIGTQATARAKGNNGGA